MLPATEPEIEPLRTLQHPTGCPSINRLIADVLTWQRGHFSFPFLTLDSKRHSSRPCSLEAVWLCALRELKDRPEYHADSSNDYSWLLTHEPTRLNSFHCVVPTSHCTGSPRLLTVQHPHRPSVRHPFTPLQRRTRGFINVIPRTGWGYCLGLGLQCFILLRLISLPALEYSSLWSDYERVLFKGARSGCLLFFSSQFFPTE